jgi:hypothetical protein
VAVRNTSTCASAVRASSCPIERASTRTVSLLTMPLSAKASAVRSASTSLCVNARSVGLVSAKPMAFQRLRASGSGIPTASATSSRVSSQGAPSSTASRSSGSTGRQ